MHQYLVDYSIRIRVVVILAITSTIIAWLVSLLLESIQFEPPFWLEVPSLFGIFGILVWIYDKGLWKLPLLARLPWLYIPDLSGDWVVEIWSSYDQSTDSLAATARIRQSGFRMSISMETDESVSASVAASIVRAEQIRDFELFYDYINEPKPSAVDTMSMHRGAAVLRFDAEGPSPDGEYFSGRGRQTYGAIRFSRTG